MLKFDFCVRTSIKDEIIQGTQLDTDYVKVIEWLPYDRLQGKIVLVLFIVPSRLMVYFSFGFKNPKMESMEWH